MLPVLTTPRLRLRPANDADIDAVWRMLVLPDVRRYLCDDVVQVTDMQARNLFWCPTCQPSSPPRI